MNNILKYFVTGLIFVTILFEGCKPKPKATIDNILLTKDTLQPIEKFDTLVFINARINHSDWPCQYGKYALASKRLLRNDDLDCIPPRELRIIRNEIFARYGYRFKDPKLQACFDNQDWYKPLFNNVDQFIKPLERDNIKFIQEKEKTNPEISDEEQFQYFLENYSANFLENRIPAMLAHKFFVGIPEECTMLFPSYTERLPATKNYIYLIYSVFGGCNECRYSLSVYQFNKKGELFKQFYLGESECASPKIDEKSNNRYELWFTYYSGPRWAGDEEPDEKTLEIARNTPLDTIRFQFHYENNGQITITEKNK